MRSSQGYRSRVLFDVKIGRGALEPLSGLDAGRRDRDVERRGDEAQHGLEVPVQEVRDVAAPSREEGMTADRQDRADHDGTCDSKRICERHRNERCRTSSCLYAAGP